MRLGRSTHTLHTTSVSTGEGDFLAGLRRTTPRPVNRHRSSLGYGGRANNEEGGAESPLASNYYVTNLCLAPKGPECRTSLPESRTDDGPFVPRPPDSFPPSGSLAASVTSTTSQGLAITYLVSSCLETIEAPYMRFVQRLFTMHIHAFYFSALLRSSLLWFTS
ncbi:hypothetical protein LZ30DRAFT_711082 [Colletotrichum cereale]|nr:hypothetical protein LZ30DRAFT_711082 [Colletotrichum cereale]